MKKDLEPLQQCRIHKARAFLKKVRTYVVLNQLKLIKTAAHLQCNFLKDETSGVRDGGKAGEGW